MSTVTLGTSTPTFLKAEFIGGTGSGAISVPGLQVGDAAILDLNGHNVVGGTFEQFVSVADEIQQLAGTDLSSQTYKLLFVRWS